MTDNKKQITVRLDPEDVETIDEFLEGIERKISEESEVLESVDYKKSAFLRLLIQHSLEAAKDGEIELYLPRAGNVNLADVVDE